MQVVGRMSPPSLCAPPLRSVAFHTPVIDRQDRFPNQSGKRCPDWSEISRESAMFSTTVHLIDFTLAGCTAEDPRKRSVECEVVWMSGSREKCKQRYQRPSNRPVQSRHVLNGHCTGINKSSLFIIRMLLFFQNDFYTYAEKFSLQVHRDSTLTPKGHEDGEEDGGWVVEEVAGAGGSTGCGELPVAACSVTQRTHGDVVPGVTDLHAESSMSERRDMNGEIDTGQSLMNINLK